jgi:hypothetical protein
MVGAVNGEFCDGASGMGGLSDVQGLSRSPAEVVVSNELVESLALELASTSASYLQTEQRYLTEN